MTIAEHDIMQQIWDKTQASGPAGNDTDQSVMVASHLPLTADGRLKKHFEQRKWSLLIVSVLLCWSYPLVLPVNICSSKTDMFFLSEFTSGQLHVLLSTFNVILKSPQLDFTIISWFIFDFWFIPPSCFLVSIFPFHLGPIWVGPMEKNLIVLFL